MLKAKKPRAERQRGFLNSQKLVSSARCTRTFCSFYFGQRRETVSLSDVCTLGHRGARRQHSQAAAEGVAIKRGEKQGPREELTRLWATESIALLVLNKKRKRKNTPTRAIKPKDRGNNVDWRADWRATNE